MIIESHPRLVVVGQGRVGLPLAMRAVETGYDVIGVDADPMRVAALRRGDSPVDEVSDIVVRAARDSGRYAVDGDFARVDGFDFAIIAVPVELRDSVPDLGRLESAARALSVGLRRGATVVLESTPPPGTTAEVLVPILEQGSGLSAGLDFSVGFSPERLDPDRTTRSLRTTPKLVSGIGPESLAKVTELYDDLVDTTVPVAGTREAEMAKLIESTFRHVNTALVNELAVAAHDLGIDIWQALAAAGTRPSGFMTFLPGPGTGDHRLPGDPTCLSWEVRRTLGRSLRFVELADSVNTGMPEHVVGRLESLLNDSARALRGAAVLVVGLASHPDGGDVRASPAVRVCELLAAKGAVVMAVDPNVADRDWPDGVARVELDAATAAAADVAVVLTLHGDVDPAPLRDCLVLDTRNVVRNGTAVLL